MFYKEGDASSYVEACGQRSERLEGIGLPGIFAPRSPGRQYPSQCPERGFRTGDGAAVLCLAL